MGIQISLVPILLVVSIVPSVISRLQITIKNRNRLKASVQNYGAMDMTGMDTIDLNGMCQIGME